MRAAAVAFVLAGIILGAVRQLDASAAEANAEGIGSNVAYAVALAMPGVIALIGRRGLVTIAAGVAGIGIAIVASFGVTLPLVVPGIMLVARGMRDHRRPDDGFRALAIACLLPWAVVVLYAHDDPVETANAFAGDVTVWWESLLSLGLSSAALVAGGLRPRAHDGEDGVGVGAVAA